MYATNAGDLAEKAAFLVLFLVLQDAQGRRSLPDPRRVDRLECAWQLLRGRTDEAFRPSADV